MSIIRYFKLRKLRFGAATQTVWARSAEVACVRWTWVPISLCFYLLYFISKRSPGIRFGGKIGEFLFLNQPWTTNSSLPSSLPPTASFPKWDQHVRPLAIHEGFLLRKDWWLQEPITCLVTPSSVQNSTPSWAGLTVHWCKPCHVSWSPLGKPSTSPSFIYHPLMLLVPTQHSLSVKSYSKK